MTHNTPEGERSPEHLLEITQALFEQAAERLGEAVLVLAPQALDAEQATTGDHAKAALQAVRDFRSAFQIAMEERTRVDKLRKQVGSSATSNGTLVLEDARVEIGSRLARLRAAGGDG